LKDGAFFVVENVGRVINVAVVENIMVVEKFLP
jgi:hypothetical protein